MALLLLTLPGIALAQNKKPKIVGQEPITTSEEQSVTILMTYLKVEDGDDWFYPFGFTMTIYPGSDYSVSGHVVTPAINFNGTLKVQVTVHDGEDESNKYDLLITVAPVNDRPVITGNETLSIQEGQSITIQTSHLKVNDPDNTYPNDFTTKVYAGNNYSVNGNTVTPNAGFTGALSVNVTVYDGQLESELYGLPVEVKALNRIPRITGQTTLQVNEDESIAIALSHLIVEDDDSTYPNGFSLSVSAGTNYTVSGTSVKPAADFFGKLSVPVTVNDGKNTSNVYNLIISVVPVSDAPKITNLETQPVFYGSGALPVPVTQSATVVEVDGDSIVSAEVGFRQANYQINADKLVYTQPEGSPIKGVFDPSSGVLTLTGQASPARYSAALKSVQFQTLSPSSEDKVIYIALNDGKSRSDEAERRLRSGQGVVSLDIPTGFTPNGDMSNDTWKIIPLKSEEAYSQAHIRVYNKFGILVYESIGFENEWDGRLNGELLPADTYYYTIDLNTSTADGYVKGLVTILR